MTIDTHGPTPILQRDRTAALPLLAPLGAVAFTASWVALGARSPGYRMFDVVVPSYSPISQPVSGLGLGETATAMNAAFVLCGLMVAVGAWATARTWPRTGRPRLRRWAHALLASSGVGMATCGVFTLESMELHSLGFLLAVGAPAVGFALAGLLLRDGSPAVARALLVAGPVALLLMGLFLATFDPVAAGAGEGVAGFVQRVLVSVVLGTLGALGVRAVRPASATAAARSTASRRAR
ncbi:DUF998 domain-containing protein [Cellulomonas cellasea]|uniref:Putative membrane protein n=1 Tax=Cellulomonas cellasea TaxID=43670 RepID=A0A7W4UHW3_9CELL|nr:DUF998 domain-containing protein [Cellulomonas cellasea]MBB2924466.1 putative membrane protein [Cellulomonas cellasea]